MPPVSYFKDCDKYTNASLYVNDDLFSLNYIEHRIDDHENWGAYSGLFWFGFSSQIQPLPMLAAILL